MSEGGNEGLFKLAEAAAPAEDRLMPTERTYLKSDKMVSVEEAVALMKKRKKDPSLRIAGGLDDTSDAVRRHHGASVDTGDSGEDDLPGMAEMLGEAPHTARKEPRRRQPGKASMSDIQSAVSLLDARLSGLVKVMTKAVSARAEPPAQAKPEPAKDVLQEFKSGSHRVTFLLNGMEFSVKCLQMVKDTAAHTVVFVFPDDGESFFTPPMQSELEAKYDGGPVEGKMYYFGMCFSIKALGLKFLGFLYDDRDGQEQV